jgi:hypothetical protein
VDGIEPCVESWDARDHLSQVRLRAYLDQLEPDLGSLPDGDNLFLHMQVDVRRPKRLLRYCDVENYLTPVVRRLGASRFRLVSGVKQVGGGSHVLMGLAVPMPAPLVGWKHFSMTAAAGPEQACYKEDLRTRLATSGLGLLPPGPAEAHLAWSCPPGRNWLAYWKPTGDAMGPVLGEPPGGNPFNPNDDRIVSLSLHRNDATPGGKVHVGLWWRSTASPPINQPVALPAPSPGSGTMPSVGQASPGPSTSSAGVIHFLDDDTGFIRWVAGNPAGLVVNCYRRPSPAYLKLHRATCPTVTGSPTNGSTWMGSYSKVCSASRQALDTWARRLGGTLNPCRRCAP